MSKLKYIKSFDFEINENKVINFINRLGDFLSIMCPKCDEKGIRSRMKKENHFLTGGMCGPGDSMYWVCPKCKHEEQMPEE